MKYNNFRKIKILLLFLLPITGIAQSYQPNIGPPSPEASTLGKFVTTPVGHYTGTPQINIPIWEIKGRGIDIPIELNYHGGGLKVGETASWIGLGWSLNVGGIVSRTVRGKPDDSAWNLAGGESIPWIGFLQTNHHIKANYSPYVHVKDIWQLGLEDRTEFYTNITAGCFDSEPDEFFFNFHNIRGSFAFSGYFDEQGNPEILINSKDKIQVNPTFDSDRHRIISWQITHVNGFIYTFAKSEKTSVVSHGEQSNLDICNEDYIYNSSWLLTKVEAPFGNYSVDFEYLPYTFEHSFQESESARYRLSGTANCQSISNSIHTSLSTRTTEGFILDRIYDSDGVEIDFLQNTGFVREDVEGDNLFPLGEITISFDGDLKRRFKLDHSKSDTDRMLLESVVETSPNEREVKPPFVFEYNPIALPMEDSKSQDYWGYYNGANNTHMIPPLAVRYGGQSILFNGANRSPSAQSMASILTKVNYPTGGYAEYEYELNDFSHLEGNVPISQVIEPNSIAVYESVSMTSSGQEDVPNEKIINITDSDIVDIVAWFPIPGDRIAPDLQLRMPYISVEPVNGTQGSLYKIYADDPGVDSDGGFSERIYLGAGEYKISAYSDPNAHGNGLADFADLQFTWYETPTDPAHTIKKTSGGGVRIKSIVYHDGISSENNIVETYHYVPEMESEYSSGVLLATELETTYYNPTLSSDLAFDFLGRYPGFVAEYAVASADCETLVRFSTNQSNLTVSNHVEYSTVFIEKENGSEKILTRLDFNGPNQFPSNASVNIPFPPAVGNSHKRGLLSGNKVYEYDGTEQIEMLAINRTYTSDNTSINGLKVMEVFDPGQSIPFSDPMNSNRFVTSFYTVTNGYSLLGSETTNYIKHGKTLTTNSTYTYNSENLLASAATSTSSGNDKKIEYMYDTGSLTNPEPDGGTNSTMAQKNILNAVRETTQKRIDNGVESIVSKERTVYLSDRSTAGIALPGIVKNAPAGLDLVEVSSFNIYDDKGNLLEYYGKDGIVVSFIWGYNKTLPVAKVIGATRQEIGTLFNDMEFFVPTVLSSSQDALLRAEFPQALITTYQHDPLIGIISEKSPQGYITTYEYDGLGRLKVIRNKDNEIIKQYEYNYAK